MALSIISNPTAIGAQNGVNVINNQLNKTIKSLSTGLRINTAADDASGLAVSEKLRTQIRGLDKAATNAQDAISMLQVAEGSLGSMTSMMQRIRELAVQAGDPAYTTNDRAMLQLEVQALKEEIDRVSVSTEFNTKKLLNGDAAAVWSSSTNNIEAVVKGEPAEGNYKIVYDATPGKNAIYKSNIMRLAEGELSYDITAGGAGISKIDNIVGMNPEKNVEIVVSATADAVEGKALLAGATGNLENIFNAEVFTDADSAAEGEMKGYSIEMEAVTSNKLVAQGTAGDRFATVSKAMTEGVATLAVGAGADTPLFTGNNVMYFDYKGETYAVAADLKYQIADGERVPTVTGGTIARAKDGVATTFTWDVTTTNGKTVLTLKDGTQDISSLVNIYEPGSAQMKFRVRDNATGNISEWSTFTLNADGTVAGGDDISVMAGNTEFKPFDGTKAFDTTDYTKLFNEGDRMLVEVSSAKADTVTATADFTITVGGNALHIAGRRENEPLPETYTIYTSQMDKAGNVYYGNIDISLERGVITEGTTTIDVLGAGDVASIYTKLSQLEQFKNADGVNVLNNTKELSIYGGNGEIAKITLEGADSVGDLRDKLNTAIVKDLGLGADKNNPDAVALNKSLVQYVDADLGNLKPGSDLSVEGTFVFQTARLGNDSRLTLVGDEALLSALGVTKIQEEKATSLDVRITDAHTGAFIGEDTVSDGRVRNVIKGVDVLIKEHSATDIYYDEAQGKVIFKDKLGQEEAFLHIKNTSTKAAIGANEGQVIDISIGRMDTVALNIHDVNVATFDEAQRSLAKIDMALEQLSTARAITGAQMNRLEYTISNLTTSRENMVASESRIRDLDIAEASTKLASQQVLIQSATAMLAQANQIPSYALKLLQ